jgi:hypothetical protein
VECLYCGNKKLQKEWKYCGECGTNIKEYEKANKFIEKGQEFEKNRSYLAAIEEYRNALKLNVPQDKILTYLKNATLKEQEIVDMAEKGRELASHKKWKRAIRVYKRVLKLNPPPSWGIESELEKISKKLALARKHKTIWGAVVVVCIIGGIVGWRGYMNTPQKMAQKIVKESILSDDIEAKLAAIETVGRLQDRRLLPLLRETLSAPYVSIRVATAKVLGELKDSLSIPLLKESLSDRDWRVRIAAAQALIALGDMSGMEVLKEAMK